MKGKYNLDSDRNEIVALLRQLVQYNTTFPEIGQEPIDEKECQNFIADYLSRLGASVDLWEPDIVKLRRYPNFIEGRTYNNRPIVVGKFEGTGGGRSLILNFHIDVVEARRDEGWTLDPFSGNVADGKMYGRGTADMKGGATAALKAVEAIQKSKLRLRGDVIVQSVTDEEINGMGTIACIERGYRADAAIFPEPTELGIYTAMRGDLIGRIIVEGRVGWPYGNAGGTIAHWTEGGPVNAIEKSFIVIDALKRLEQEWEARPDKTHDLFPPIKINLTSIRAGKWNFIPGRCEITFATGYLPKNKDDRGLGSLVQQEIEDCVAKASEADAWLRQHLPKIEWIADLPGADLAMKHPIVGVLNAAAKEHGINSKVTTLDTADDVSILMNMAGVPGIEFGPGSNTQAHAADEFVRIYEVVHATNVIATAICNWCGVE